MRVPHAPQRVDRPGHLRHPDGAVPGLREIGLVADAPEPPAGIQEAWAVRRPVHDPVTRLHPERIAAVEPDRPGLAAAESPFGRSIPPPARDQPGQARPGSCDHFRAAGLRQLERRRETVLRSPCGKAPACKVTDHPRLPDDPQRAVPRAQQLPDAAGRKRIAVPREKGRELHAVEAHQPGRGAQPEVAVAGLRERADFGGCTILDRPRRVGELVDGADRDGVLRRKSGQQDGREGDHRQENCGGGGRSASRRGVRAGG